MSRQRHIRRNMEKRAGEIIPVRKRKKRSERCSPILIKRQRIMSREKRKKEETNE